MIPTQILYEHEGKVVTLYTTRGTFEGILEMKNSGLLVVLKTEGIAFSERYGSVYIDTQAIVAIREIKPRAKKDYGDEGEDDCCEKESPKAYFKAKEDKQMVEQLPGYDERGKQITGNYVISVDIAKDLK
jgi:hypothetical protein